MEIDFNIFRWFDSCNTMEDAFVGMTLASMRDSIGQLGDQKVGMQDVASFMRKIWQGYAEFNPTYHNGIHGADVCQMTYVMLKTGNIGQLAKLDALDTFSVLIAAACHDFRHDGFTNNYHARIESDRFKEFGEAGCQEKFHFA